MGWPKINPSFPNCREHGRHFKATSFSFLIHLVCLPIIESFSVLKKNLFHIIIWIFVPLTQRYLGDKYDGKRRNFLVFHLPPSVQTKTDFLSDFSWGLDQRLCVVRWTIHTSYLLIQIQFIWFIELVNEHLYIIVFFVWAFFVVSLLECVYVCVSVCI